MEREREKERKRNKEKEDTGETTLSTDIYVNYAYNN